MLAPTMQLNIANASAPENQASKRPVRESEGPVPWAGRARPCARAAFGTLLLVKYKRLVAPGAAQLHTGVVYRQSFAVR